MKLQTADIREVAENHLLHLEQVIRRQHHSTDASFIGSTSRRLSQLPSVEGDHAPGLRAAFDGYVDYDFSFQAGGGAWTFERNLQRLTLSTDTFAGPRSRQEGTANQGDWRSDEGE